jgi:hypothetical protein
VAERLKAEAPVSEEEEDTITSTVADVSLREIWDPRRNLLQLRKRFDCVKSGLGMMCVLKNDYMTESLYNKCFGGKYRLPNHQNF